MGKALLDFGLQLAQGVAGAGMGMLLGKAQDARQMKMQEELANRQYMHNKDLMDQSYKHQFDMWKKTNYTAQMAELAKAGLNPGLLYGMGGQGGMTTGGGGSSVGLGTASTSTAPTEMAGMAMQLGLMRAQKENIEADTAKKQAETTKTAGVDTKEAETRILDLTQGIENKKTQQALNEVQKRISEIQENIQSRTQEDAVRAIGWNAEKIMQEMEDLRYRNLINEDTWKTKVEIVQTELAGLYIKNALMRSEIKVNDQQIQSMATKIVQEWRELEIKHKDADTRQKQQALNEWVNDVQNSTKLTAETIGNIIGGVLRKGKGSKTYREGERNGKPYSEYSETSPF